MIGAQELGKRHDRRRCGRLIVERMVSSWPKPFSPRRHLRPDGHLRVDARLVLQSVATMRGFGVRRAPPASACWRPIRARFASSFSRNGIMAVRWRPSSWGYVDIVHLLPVHLDNLVAVTAGNTGVGQAAVFVGRLGGLRDNVFISISAVIYSICRRSAVRCAYPPFDRAPQ
jgi:hypothetical protein